MRPPSKRARRAHRELDQAAADYKIAYMAYVTYHTTATASNQAAVTAALTKVQTDVASIKVN